MQLSHRCVKNICGTYNCPTDTLYAICCRLPAARPHDCIVIACSVCTVDLAFYTECNAVQKVIILISQFMQLVKQLTQKF